VKLRQPRDKQHCRGTFFRIPVAQKLSDYHESYDAPAIFRLLGFFSEQNFLPMWNVTEGKKVLWIREVAESRNNDFVDAINPTAKTRVGQQRFAITQQSVNGTLQFLRTSPEFKSGKVNGSACVQLKKKTS
jgi:hypothetical protein